VAAARLSLVLFAGNIGSALEARLPAVVGDHAAGGGAGRRTGHSPAGASNIFTPATKRVPKKGTAPTRRNE